MFTAIFHTTRAVSICQGKLRAFGTGMSLTYHLLLSVHPIAIHVQSRCSPLRVAKECCVLTKYQRADKPSLDNNQLNYINHII